MLVLSRKVGERLLLGEDIVVTVVRIEGGSIRLGIEAPAQVRILRHEFREQTLPCEAPQTRFN